MKKSFLFITGLVRALEKRRLSDEMVRSMVERSDPDNMREILRATYYRDWVPEGSGFFAFEPLLHRSREWALGLAAAYGGEDLCAIFRMPRDYHNIRTLLRGIIFNRNQAGLLSQEGMISAGVMRTLLEENRYDELPGLMGYAARESMEIFYSTKSILQMDLCLDSWLARDLLKMAGHTECPMVLKHQMLAIDAANAGIFLRAGDMRKNESVRSKLYLPGGFLETGIFVECRSLTELAFAMERSDMHSILAAGIRRYDSNVFALECEADMLLLSAVEDAAFRIDGPEPLYAFLCRADWELRVLGMILSAGPAGNRYVRMRLEGMI